MNETNRADAPTPMPVRPCQVEALKIERLETDNAELRAENSLLKDEIIALQRELVDAFKEARLKAAFIKAAWTFEEEEKLIGLWEAGSHSVSKIGRELKRPYHSIRGKLERLRALGRIKRVGSFGPSVEESRHDA